MATQTFREITADEFESRAAVSNALRTPVRKMVFVSSVRANSNGDGSSMATAFSTVAEAATAGGTYGDVIYVEPGHTETLASAGAITLPAGMTVFCGGYGGQRGTFTFATAAAASLNMSGAGGRFHNANFAATYDGVTSAINLSGNGTSLTDCKFVMGTGTGAHVLIAATITGDDVRVENCDLVSGAFAGVDNALLLTGADRLRVVNCNIQGNFTAASKGCIHTATTANTNILIDGCTLVNGTSAAEIIFDNNSLANSGMIRNCAMLTTDTGLTAWFGNASNAVIAFNGNTIANAAAETGGIAGTVST